MKYPYSYEEFERETIKQFKNRHKKQYDTIDKDEMIDEIKKSYSANKYQHENNISKALNNIENEVSGAVYNLSMF